METFNLYGCIYDIGMVTIAAILAAVITLIGHALAVNSYITFAIALALVFICVTTINRIAHRGIKREV